MKSWKSLRLHPQDFQAGFSQTLLFPEGYKSLISLVGAGVWKHWANYRTFLPIFTTLVILPICFIYSLVSIYRYSLDLWDNVLYDWLFPHHWVGGRYLTYTVLVNSDISNLYLLVDSLHSCSMIHVSILIGLKLCSARKCMVYQTKYLYQT